MTGWKWSQGSDHDGASHVKYFVFVASALMYFKSVEKKAILSMNNLSLFY